MQKLPKSAIWRYLFQENTNTLLSFLKHSDQKERTLEIVSNIFKQVPRVTWPYNFIDIGCGDGSLTFAIVKLIQRYLIAKPSDITVHLVDPSKEMLTLTKESFRNINGRFEIYQAALGDESFDIQFLYPNYLTFDFVFMSFCLFWIDEIEKAVSQMKSILKKGGRLLLIDHSVKDTFRNEINMFSYEYNLKFISELSPYFKKDDGYKSKIGNFKYHIDLRDVDINLLKFILKSPELPKDYQRLLHQIPSTTFHAAYLYIERIF